METWSAISGRRNVREYDDRPIEPQQLERILEAGRWAPSSKNGQPWHFIVCTDRERLLELARAGAYTGHVAGAAAVIALVVPEGPESWENEVNAFDLGQAAQNMMLAAWDMGIGSSHASVYEPGLVRDLLGYPEDHRCDLLVSFGYPADARIAQKKRSGSARRPLAAIVHRERW